MPTNAFGQQVYDPNAGGNPLLSQLQQANANRPQPNGSNAYNWSGNGWLNDMNRAATGGAVDPSGGFEPGGYASGNPLLSQLQQANANRPQPNGSNAYNWSGNGWVSDMNRAGGGGMLGAMPSVDAWTQGFQGSNGDQVRSSVAPLSPSPTQNTNTQQSAPQDRYGSAYESNPNVTWSYGGQTTVNPLDRGQFLTQSAAQNLAGQLGQGYTNNAWQLGGPAAYSAPMQTINNLHNAGLVQQMLDRGMPIDQVRSQLDREAAMARGGTQTTLNNPGQAQSESERMYQSMGLVRGADGQWRTPQNAQQTGAAGGAPQASPSQQQRYGPLVNAMQQQRMGQGPGPNGYGGSSRTPGAAPVYTANPNEGPSGPYTANMYGDGQAMSNPTMGPGMSNQQRSEQQARNMQNWAIGPGGSRINPEDGTMVGGSGQAMSDPGDSFGFRNDGGSGFRNAMFGQRLGQYGQGQPAALGGIETPSGPYNPNPMGYAGGMGGSQWNIPENRYGGGYQSGGGASNLPGYSTNMQRIASRGGQGSVGGAAPNNNLGYDPYYYGPQARGPQARQPGWQYPQNTGAFQLYNHGSQESNDLSAFNQRMQSQEQANMPASWRTAQNAGRGGGGSWDWNQGARAY